MGVYDTDARNPGVVVENFSYVFQLTGGAKSITRDEMRAFKKAWAKFANPKTQHLERNRFVPFFAVSFPRSLSSYLTSPESGTRWGIRTSDLPSPVQPTQPEGGCDIERHGLEPFACRSGY